MKVSVPTLLCLAAALVGAHGANLASVAATTTKRTHRPAFFRTAQNIGSSSSLRNLRSSDPSVVAVLAERIPRGGACKDSAPALFAKIGAGAAVESAALLGILLASIKYAETLTSIQVFGEPLPILLASFFVIFGSSFVGAIVDGSMSVASRQALDPTAVQGDPHWYANLEKPAWNPPGWLFPIMWLIVSKPTQLCALSRIAKYGLERNEAGVVTGVPMVALAIYTTMLALGDAWNKVFFGLECIGRGTVVITFFFAALLASAYLFYEIDEKAGLYMLPTCGWVAVATSLQYSIYLRNQDASSIGGKKKSRKN